MGIHYKEEQLKAAREYFAKMASDYVKEMHFEMPYDLSKKFRSLMLIEQDLRFMKKMANRLLDMSKINSEDKDLQSCMWQCIATCYGKISTKSKSGFSNIEDSWFKSDSFLIDAHHKIMLWRNKFVAHRENSEFEHSIAYFKTTQIGDAPQIHKYEIRALAKVMPNIEEQRKFIGLLEYLEKETTQKLEEEAAKVMIAFHAKELEFKLHHLVDNNYNQIGAI